VGEIRATPFTTFRQPVNHLSQENAKRSCMFSICRTRAHGLMEDHRDDGWRYRLSNAGCRGWGRGFLTDQCLSCRSSCSRAWSLEGSAPPDSSRPNGVPSYPCPKPRVGPFRQKALSVGCLCPEVAPLALGLTIVAYGVRPIPAGHPKRRPRGSSTTCLQARGATRIMEGVRT
jgi:hypothetical protein